MISPTTLYYIVLFLSALWLVVLAIAYYLAYKLDSGETELGV